MSVHYKFKNNLDYDTVTFDGLHISVADLKKSILQQKKIGKSSDFDLQITNAQTKEVYDNEETLVPKNTSVIVARVPIVTGNKKTWERPDLPLPLDESESLGQIRYDKIAKSADLVNSNASEDDKVKAMINQSSQEYDPSKYVKSRSMTGPLPPSYTCYRCGKQGHWIRECPTNNLDVKRSTGIPRSFMVPVDGPEHKGALLTSSGEYAVPLIDHQAYKEVKKEKPPFVQDVDPVVETDAQVPEELLCMVCRDLLQDAVLIPCCGNSFCDECVRQVLLDSDNHECPQCHETGISPDTVIPNRFLRTAVLNFKNETGYTRVRRYVPIEVPQPHLESPQPSPDSTVENHPAPQETVEIDINNTDNKTSQVEPLESESDSLLKNQTEQLVENKPVIKIDKEEIGDNNIATESVENVEEEVQDTQPGTPLADEPPVDMAESSLPIQTIDHGHYEDQPNYHSTAYIDYSHGDNDSRDGHISSEHGQISTIETITNTRKYKYSSWAPGAPHQYFSQSRQHHHGDRSDNYDGRDRSEYRGRYDRRGRGDRHQNRSLQQSAYERSPRESKYRRNGNQRAYREYPTETKHIPDVAYELPIVEEPVRRRHRYATPPPPGIPPTQQSIDVAPPYTAIPHQQPALLATPQPFPPQPPPPGASPVDTSQPPPPGVGPLLPAPVLSDSASNYDSKPFDAEETKSKPVKTEDRSIDDRLEAFQRELEKRERQSVRDRSSRSSSSSRSRDRSRSSSSRSRSYSSSKSWSRSPSRSISRSSRSRTRTPYSSRSRSRSFSRSRSRSRSKSRSFTRSRTRSRTKSRSRSRDHPRVSPRERERTRTPVTRSHSTSLSPKIFHARNRRSPYQMKRMYNPPQYTGSYAPPYVAPLPPPAAMMTVPLIRAPPYAPSHIQTVHPSVHSQPPVHAHAVDHYAVERPPRYSHYNAQYSGYEMYQQPQKSYSHQRYEREPRNSRFDKQQQQQQEYQKDYQRRSEEIQHRIPGWVGERGRDYKPRYRIPRDQQRKEIRELPKEKEIREIPKVIESEIRVVRTRETRQETPVKKREDKPIKHKKHHHHRTKESKRQEKPDNKIPVVIGVEKTPETPENLIKVEVLSDKAIEIKKEVDVQPTKSLEKGKEKKHKHKKHKIGEQAIKKKKATKKERSESTIAASEAAGTSKVKTKKKKNKNKISSEGKKKSEKVTTKSKGSSETQHVTNTPPEVVEKVSAKNEIRISEDTALRQESDGEFVSGFDYSENPNDIENDDEMKITEVPLASEADIQEGIPEEKDDSLTKTPDVIEHVDSAEEEEEEEENIDEGEDEFHIELPALSKWEREEFEREEEILSKPQRKSSVVIPKEEKGSLSSEIIQRAEKAILHKALKTAIVVNKEKPIKEKSSHKMEKKISTKAENLEGMQSAETMLLKYMEQPEPKRSSSTECSKSPTLQVTITTDKEKRSVHTKKESSHKEQPKNETQQLKKVKLDRSNFPIKAEPVSSQNLQRTVAIAEHSESADKSESKRKIKNVEPKHTHTKISASEKANNETRSSYHERKEYSSRMQERERERTEFQRRRSRSREEKRRNYTSHERRRSSRDRSDTLYYSDRGDRNRRTTHESTVQDKDREKRFSDRNLSKSYERPARYNRRSRSRSFDSSDSYHSGDRRYHSKRETERLVDVSSGRSDVRRRDDSRLRSQNEASSQPNKVYLSKIKSEQDRDSDHIRSRSKHYPEDEVKFEPNYDEFSDEDHNRNISTEKQKLKRGMEQSEHNKKRLRHEQQIESNVTSTTHDTEIKKGKSRVDRSSVTSSPSSSAVSESDSSDTESGTKGKSQNSDTDHKQKHKRSRHKKHKKHKHKHKKKKSHKSKQKS